MGARKTVHLPSAAAAVLYLRLFHRTVTFSPFAAQPQILILASLCSTMLSRTSRGSLTCATAGKCMERRNAAMLIKCFIIDIPLFAGKVNRLHSPAVYCRHCYNAAP